MWQADGFTKSGGEPILHDGIQQLDFPEHLGILNEEQWKWLLKRRLGSTIKNLPALVKTYRQFQPAIAALDSHIATTNRAIDQITYRLYGLSQAEIATVEEK